MKKTFLITGATGFVGSNIIRELLKNNHRVFVVVRDKKLNWRLTDIASKLDIFECDIQDSKELSKVVKKIKPDYIFHLAHYGNKQSEDNVYKMINSNLKGTINLIQAAKQNPFTLFVNTGSGIEYGIKNSSMKESDILEPISNYGVVKSTITFYCRMEAIRNKLPIVTLRLFTPYGFYEDKGRLIPDVALSALKGEPIKVSSRKHIRDFIFIEDVVGAYLQAIRIKHAPGEIYNVGSGKEASVKDIVDMILKITKSKSPVKWGSVPKQARYIEPVHWQADMSKSKKVLHFEPKHTLSDGLEKTIEWFTNHRGLYERN